MALAGVWEHWLGADGSELETMAILTVAANATVGAIHERMPMIVAPTDFDRWLDCKPGSAEPIRDLLGASPDLRLEVMPVKGRLNNAPENGTNLLRELDDDQQAKLL